eukprot:TRINITY_DN11255_c0_g1_i1.p1 TRINITY_DN11255_c0_g1~~TRINITY_DN11255_c0_g1_i1.p1  ORF type:complete len:391 (-),score=35.97 TRINITY_DN11255_c0_g1_i1:53-1225(-)
MLARFKLLWQGARRKLPQKNARFLIEEKNISSIFGKIAKRHPARSVAFATKVTMGFSLPLAIWFFSEDKNNEANWLQKSTVKQLVHSMNEKASLRSIKMLTYLISTNECYAVEFINQNGEELLSKLFDTTLETWRSNESKDGDDMLLQLLKLMSTMNQYEQPKKTFQKVKWVSLFNSLAAEKNADIVNHVSSVLSSLAVAPNTRRELVTQLLDGLSILIKNQYCSEEAYHHISVALAALSSKDEQLAEYMIKTGLVRRLKKITALPDERVQLQIAKTISNLSAFEDLRKIIVAQGWLEQLRYWGESENKQVRLQAIQVLSNLVLYESIVVQLLEQQGLELILAMGELVDIDIQHAVERVINQLKTPDVLWVPREYKLDDNFDLVEQQRGV